MGTVRAEKGFLTPLEPAWGSESPQHVALEARRAEFPAFLHPAALKACNFVTHQAQFRKRQEGERESVSHS